MHPAAPVCPILMRDVHPRAPSCMKRELVGETGSDWLQAQARRGFLRCLLPFCSRTLNRSRSSLRVPGGEKTRPSAIVRRVTV